MHSYTNQVKIQDPHRFLNAIKDRIPEQYRNAIHIEQDRIIAEDVPTDEVARVVENALSQYVKDLGIRGNVTVDADLKSNTLKIDVTTDEENCEAVESMLVEVAGAAGLFVEGKDRLGEGPVEKEWV